MPLHDWTDDRGWDSVHHYWIADLARWIKPRLPEGYRAFVGSAPGVTIDATPGRPDVAVREWQPAPAEAASSSSTALVEPDDEAVAVFPLTPPKAVQVFLRGRLVAAIELVSPRNKDRPQSREFYANRYLGYLAQDANLLLIDLHPRPAKFSFADTLAAALRLEQPACPPPFAIAYRVGEQETTSERLVAWWRRPLVVGQVLPAIPLPLSVDCEILVDLEQTYRRAAADAYLGDEGPGTFGTP